VNKVGAGRYNLKLASLKSNRNSLKNRRIPKSESGRPETDIGVENILFFGENYFSAIMTQHYSILVGSLA
jgi:hypothetical protein